MAYIIGLTGVMASGKSTVTAILRELGQIVVDADQIARQLSEQSVIIAQIAERLGQSAVKPDGSLDRAWVATQVFSDKSKLKQLNGLLHPLVRQKMHELSEVALKSLPDKLVFWDVPLLFEGDLWQDCQATILVWADEDVRLKRIEDGKKFKVDDYKARVAKQMGLVEKAKLADYIVYNNATIQHTRSQVESLLNHLRRQLDT